MWQWLFESGKDFLIWVGPDGEIRRCSADIGGLLGLDQAKLVGAKFGDFLPRGEKKLWKEVLQKGITAGHFPVFHFVPNQTINCELLLLQITQDVESKEVLCHFLNRNEKQKPYRVLEELLGLARLALWSWEIGTDSLLLDEAGKDLVGIKGEQSEFGHEEIKNIPQLGPFREKIEEAIKKKVAFQFEVEVPKDNEKRDGFTRVYGWPVIVEGEVQRILGLLQDATSDKYEVESLSSLASILRVVQDSIIGLDQEGKINVWNPSAEALLGYSKEEVLGKPPFFMIPDDRMDEAKYLKDLLQKGITRDFETFRQHKDGSLVKVFMSQCLLKNSDGKILGSASVLKNLEEVDLGIPINSEAGLEEVKVEIEKAKWAKELFLSNMSHELKTPMNVILGMSELLGESNPSDEQKKLLKTMQSSCEVLMGLVEDLLDLTRVEKNELELKKAPFKVPELVDTFKEMYGFMAREKGLEFDIELSAELPEIVVGDSGRVLQVISNIIGNAIKFTEKGKITLSVQKGMKERLLFTIKDTGKGIAEDKRDEIYAGLTMVEETHSRHSSGIGLGLTLAKKLTGIMGGTIHLDSELNVGTTLKVWIPFEYPENKGAATVSFKDELPEIKILMVDDSEDNLSLLRAYFKGTPVTVVEATNGLEALEQFKQDRFDLVLMDLQMPVMDGLTATREIRDWELREGRMPIPILAVTAYTLKEDREKALAAGCDTHISKPIKKKKLFREIIHYMANSKARRVA